MAYDIYSPAFMLPLVRELPQNYTFIKDRYFGGTPEVFKTEEVIVDYDDGDGRVMAPFVIPAVGPVPLTRDGYETNKLTPPYIAISLPLTVETLAKRMAGESIVSDMTPEQREKIYLAKDMNTLDLAITRREEWMCVNTMLDNECKMTHIGNNGAKGRDLIVRYYNGTNEGVFKPSKVWAASDDENKPGVWYTDLCNVLSDMRKKGRNATDLIVGSQVAEMIFMDKWVWKMLDNRRAELGEVDPRWQAAGVTRIGKLNFRGKDLEIFCYEGTYEERDAKTRALTTKDYFPSTGVLLAEQNSGKRMYGAVNQMEKDEQFHTREGERIPKATSDVEHNVKATMLTSRPIACPKIKSPWRGCRDVFKAN